jgi:putative chitinase
MTMGVKITAGMLAQMMPRLKAAKIGEYLPLLNAALEEFEINTPMRAAAFLAQLAHESAELSTWTENLNYSADALMRVWPKRFNAQSAAVVARQPERIANLVYANRLGNGSPESGDGWRHRGRGPIMITGLENYRIFGGLLGIDLVADPDLAATPAAGFRIAGLYWKRKRLNEFADAGNFREVTERINGALIGWPERCAYFERNKKVLRVA